MLVEQGQEEEAGRVRKSILCRTKVAGVEILGQGALLCRPCTV